MKPVVVNGAVIMVGDDEEDLPIQTLEQAKTKSRALRMACREERGRFKKGLFVRSGYDIEEEDQGEYMESEEVPVTSKIPFAFRRVPTWKWLVEQTYRN